MKYFNLKGKQFIALKSKEQFTIINEFLKYWRNHGFPYYDKNDEKFKKDFLSLFQIKNSEIFYNKTIKGKRNGLLIANYFHPQIWHVKVKNAYSPIERFNDDYALKKIIINSARMWPDRFSFRPGCIRNSIRLYSKTRVVSNFSPAIAKGIIKRYSNNNDIVMDFSAGYGGRLLGCLVLNRNYVGIDPAFAQIEGCEKIYAYCKKHFKNKVKSNAFFYHGKAEEVLYTFKNEYCQLVFTSPPYFDHEKYENNNGQSYINYHTYEQWKLKFLNVVIVQAHRILGKGGHFVVHLKNVNGHNLIKDFLDEAIKYFTLKTVYKKEVKRRPYRYIDKYKGSHNYEKIIVLKKE